MSSRRRERHMEHALKRKGKATEINVVSLIDIFAILVFYLLVNALVVEVLPEYQNVKLPFSESREKPKEAVIVAISGSDIFVGDQPIMTTAAALELEQRLLPPLSEALARLMPAALEETDNLQAVREVNILADRQISYRLLKKVLATCTDAKFDRISLAVTKGTTGSGV